MNLVREYVDAARANCESISSSDFARLSIGGSFGNRLNRSWEVHPMPRIDEMSTPSVKLYALPDLGRISLRSKPSMGLAADSGFYEVDPHQLLLARAHKEDWETPHDGEYVPLAEMTLATDPRIEALVDVVNGILPDGIADLGRRRNIFLDRIDGLLGIKIDSPAEREHFLGSMVCASLGRQLPDYARILDIELSPGLKDVIGNQSRVDALETSELRELELPDDPTLDELPGSQAEPIRDLVSAVYHLTSEPGSISREGRLQLAEQSAFAALRGFAGKLLSMPETRKSPLSVVVGVLDAAALHNGNPLLTSTYPYSY